MTIAEQLHASKTHKPGSDPNCPVCTPAASEDQSAEVLYILECSPLGANDWARAGSQDYDSMESAIKDIKLTPEGWDYRVIKRTITDDPVRLVYGAVRPTAPDAWNPFAARDEYIRRKRAGTCRE